MNRVIFENVDKFFHLQHQKTLKELVQALSFRKKTLEYVQALRDVNFEIAKGETVGIIGKNGAGKSTILKLIAGVSSPTNGKVKIQGQVAPLIELGAGFHPELTGRENIFLNGVILGLEEKYIKKKFNEIVKFSGLDKKFIEMPVKHYSSGMYMRLAFSVAVFTDPDILIIDEILTVGDEMFQKKCFSKMEEFKRKDVTIVFVSHSLSTVKDFCKRVLYLKEGSIAFDGKATEGVHAYSQDFEKERKLNK